MAVNEACKDQERWSRMWILNTARIGRFSQDRVVREYCEQIRALESAPMSA